MKKIRLGTRGSPLALRQTEMVRAELARVAPDLQTEIVIIKTSGDWDSSHGENPLPENGGKGLFAKEIEEALLRGEIDAGIHSMKDMENRLAPGLVIEHMLPREDPRDVILFKDLAKSAQSLESLPDKLAIGTCSVRRQAFLLSRRPDLRMVTLRGNVQTRIDKLARGESGIESIVLAHAGMKRLGIPLDHGFILDQDDMLPAAGQGAVGIEMHELAKDVLAIFSQISDFDTVCCVKSERAALAILDGSCRSPIGAFASLENGQMHLRLKVVRPDGTESYFEEARAAVSGVREAEKLGAELAQKLKARMPAGFLTATAIDLRNRTA